MRFFKKTQSDDTPSKLPSKKKVFFTLFLIVLFTVLAIPEFLQLKNLANRLADNQDNLRFAMDHPQIIANIREQYTNQQKKLETSFLEKEPSAQDKLLQEITNQLQSKK